MATGVPIHTNTGPARMSTDLDLLTMTQWLSPSFPLGSFAYSHGVETAIAQGWINDAASLQLWLQDVLRDGTGRADVTLLYAAYGAGCEQDLSRIDATARAFSASRERLRESVHQGRAFVRTLREISDINLPDLVLPVALGWASAQVGLPKAQTAAMYLHAFSSNIVMAAVRLVPLGQTEGQKVIAALSVTCCDVADAALGDSLEDLSSTTFLSDISAMQHETLQPRLFQS